MSRRILVVDDEKDIATILKQGLENSGFKVDSFTDPEEALSHFKADYYDVILLDVKTPKMNGFELCRELVKIDGKPKICFMTAFEVKLDEAKLMFPTLKADAFMKKPIAISKVLNIIQTALNTP